MSDRASNNIPPSLRKVWQQEEDQPKMSSTQSFTGKAIVCHDTLQSGGWKLEDVTTKECADDELVVEMLATGICHTDVMVSDTSSFQTASVSLVTDIWWIQVGTAEAPSPMALYPRVLGHAGQSSHCY